MVNKFEENGYVEDEEKSDRPRSGCSHAFGHRIDVEL